MHAPNVGLQPLGQTSAATFKENLAALTADEAPITPPKKITKAQLKLATTAAKIRDTPPEERRISFLGTYLGKCTLPHKDPGTVPVWTRKNGGTDGETLVVQPGWDIEKKCSIGYPYGALPLLILIWIVTEALRTKCRHIELGKSFAEFARALGVDIERGGQSSNAGNLKKQLTRLLTCHISFHRSLKGVYAEAGVLRAKEGRKIEPLQVASNYELWWDARKPRSHSLFESSIDLSLDFYDSITKSAIPICLDSVLRLKKSPLAINLYILCAYLTHYIEQRNLEQYVLTWDYLKQQLGGDYKSQRELGRKVKFEMKKVQDSYPDLRIKYKPQGGGMVILRSRLAVERRSQRPENKRSIAS